MTEEELFLESLQDLEDLAKEGVEKSVWIKIDPNSLLILCIIAKNYNQILPLYARAMKIVSNVKFTWQYIIPNAIYLSFFLGMTVVLMLYYFATFLGGIL